MTVQSPIATAMILVFVSGMVKWASSRSGWEPLFRRLPAPLFAYFIPAILSWVGGVPSTSPLYRWTAIHLLPLCLALLVINLDLGALKQLGGPAVRAMLWAAGGMGGGLVVGFVLVHPGLPEGAWKSVGSLAGSWTGGSANLIAVKEALNTGESLFSPIVLVDALFAYSWMGVLVWGAAYQPVFHRWVGVSPLDMAFSVARDPVNRNTGWRTPFLAIAIALVSVFFGQAVGPALSRRMSNLVPGLSGGFGPSVWPVLMVTTLGLVAAGTGFSVEKSDRTQRWGSTLLLFLLTTLGAQASLSALSQAPAFLLFGAVALIVHGMVLVVGTRVSRLPLSVMATASQACVGGVVSAPLVGAVYHPRLAPVGLLLALVGNLVGTYVGLATAWVCCWIESIFKYKAF